MRTCKVAVVGAGYMATEHLKALAALPGVEPCGIFSRTRARAEQLAQAHPGLVVCDSMADLYERTGADLVVVTVTELAMRETAQAAFAFPWTVLLEKPAGYDLADAKAIVEAARAGGRRVHVALNRRAYSSTRAARRRLAGFEGQRFIRVEDQQDMEAALNVHKHPAKVVANWMYANSIHVIDYLRVLGRGKVIRVTPVAPWDARKPGVVVAGVEFDSGDVGMYEGIWDGPGPWAVTVSTKAERLEMRPLEQLSVQLRGERKLTPVPVEAIDTDFKPGVYYQAQQAVNAALGQPADLPTLEDALESMQLVADIFGLDS